MVKDFVEDESHKLILTQDDLKKYGAIDQEDGENFGGDDEEEDQKRGFKGGYDE